MTDSIPVDIEEALKRADVLEDEGDLEGAAAMAPDDFKAPDYLDRIVSMRERLSWSLSR